MSFFTILTSMLLLAGFLPGYYLTMLTIEKARYLQLERKLGSYAGYAYSLAERTFSFMDFLRMLCSLVRDWR